VAEPPTDAPSGEPWAWSATEIASRVRRREIRAIEVVDSHLARMEATDPSLGAVTRHLHEDARQVAVSVDAAISEGNDVGPMAGVPITIKDNADVAGQSTPNGVPALADALAPSSAPFVEHLQAAGAIVIGRTNTPDFSWRWHTDNPLFGPTLNPWNESITPGGSSGGAAAAVAMGIGALAHGNDAGGSLRWPATCCGVTSIKPTRGRVPSHNASAPSERSPAIDLYAVQGPMGRSVTDVRMGLDVMSQASWRDPGYVPAATDQPHGRRAGIHYGAGAALDPEVGAAVEAAAARLAAAGWVVTDVEVPDLEASARGWATLLNTDFHHTTRDVFVELGSPALALMLEVLDDRAPALDLDGYIETLQARSTQVRSWQQLLSETVDVVVLPVAMEPAWPAGDDATSSARLDQIHAANTPLVAMNFLGLPAAAQPIAVRSDRPVGVQIVAAPFHESVALDAAASIEDDTPFVEQLWSRRT